MRDRRWLPVGLLAAFGVLLGLVVAGLGVDRLDHAARRAALAHRVGWLATAADDLTRVVSPGFDALLLGLGAAALAYRARSLRPLVLAATAGWVGAAAVVTVKYAVGRTGPRQPNDSVSHLSFPSGHTATALVCFGILALLAGAGRPRLERALLAAVAVLTVAEAAALVYDSFHWLTDTVGSVLLGLAVLTALRAYLTRTASRPGPASSTRSRRTAPARSSEWPSEP